MRTEKNAKKCCLKNEDSSSASLTSKCEAYKWITQIRGRRGLSSLISYHLKELFSNYFECVMSDIKVIFTCWKIFLSDHKLFIL